MHKKKKIAPIIIGILGVIYYLAIGCFLIIVDGGFIFNIIVSIICIALSGVLIYVVKERIQEIDGGEEDDLNNY